MVVLGDGILIVAEQYTARILALPLGASGPTILHALRALRALPAATTI